jgi:hypothetical protein
MPQICPFCRPLLMIAFVSLLVSTAHAGTIQFTGTSGVIAKTESGPVDFGLIFTHRDGIGQPSITDAVITIPEVDISDDVLTWTINAANVATFGADWSDIETWISFLPYYNGPKSTMRVIWFHGADTHLPTVSMLNDIPLRRDQHIAGFVVDHLEIIQRYWVHRPEINQAVVDWRVVGSGFIVPEPSTLPALLSCMFCLLVPYRRSCSCSRIPR